ncbi:hypothetical protein BST21_22890 [Mycolicibacterium celeriflavum]|nr:hypothetical protein BST21_22890 [Mycolicibacterium celeriflavum]
MLQPLAKRHFIVGISETGPMLGLDVYTVHRLEFIAARLNHSQCCPLASAMLTRSEGTSVDRAR